jgi:hypothetical protein
MHRYKKGEARGIVGAAFCRPSLMDVGFSNCESMNRYKKGEAWYGF